MLRFSSFGLLAPALALGLGLGDEVRVRRGREHGVLEVPDVLLVRVGGLIIRVEVRRRGVVVVVLLLVVARGRPREALEDGFLVVLLRFVVRAEGVGGRLACARGPRVSAL